MCFSCLHFYFQVIVLPELYFTMVLQVWKTLNKKYDGKIIQCDNLQFCNMLSYDWYIFISNTEHNPQLYNYSDTRFFFFVRILFIRIMRLKSWNIQNNLRTILRLIFCYSTLKNYLNILFPNFIKNKNILRIFSGCKLNI